MKCGILLTLQLTVHVYRYMAKALVVQLTNYKCSPIYACPYNYILFHIYSIPFRIPALVHYNINALPFIHYSCRIPLYSILSKSSENVC